ncbi:MAG: D-aminoacylase [Chloroflexi bacterium]|nr:D-aminoacylase [Chloroflexota bacterium]
MDILMVNGLVIDGTGNPGYRAAVGVEGDHVRIFRGDVSHVQADRIIDAAGLVVCPGFIDMHAHSGLVMLAEPDHKPKVHQGITTEVIGVDGNSYAPLPPEEFGRFLELNSGLDGNPLLPGRWKSVAEYLSYFDQKAAVNVAYVVGNSPLRISALGWEDRRPTAKELANMKSLLREAMEEGAFGMSTGLDYPPGSYADTDELVALCQEVARLGGIYHTHVRYWLGDRFLDPFQEAIEIGRRSNVPLHITHFYLRAGAPGGGRRLIDLVERAREGGLDVTFDSYPYVYGGTRLLIVFPQWAHDGGPERLKAALRSPEARERLRKEVKPRAPTWGEMWLTYFKRPHNHRFEGWSVEEIAKVLDRPVVDTVCDLLLEEDLQVSFTLASVEGPSLPEFVCHPLSMVGSDALLIGDFPSPRTYGTFPVILAEFVREERLLSLPEAIRKMTSYPAMRLGLRDRGILRDGAKADITVFNPATVKAPATRTKPKQLPVGIDYVIVNGQVVVDRGKHTGARPGRALRFGRD